MTRRGQNTNDSAVDRRPNDRPTDQVTDGRTDGRRSSTGRGSLPPSWLRVRRLIKMVPPLGISGEGKKDIPGDGHCQILGVKTCPSKWTRPG